ncbi:HNH endonuclease [Allokutzneria albata]|uniref:Putative restriction endonuclease n=1 Tax=Allokutzneria albata TaxID=211114 RepID=A0A1H0BTU9_ALLAB|nr:HNH endonuclease [Allokutzneria albata]SDN48993.1 putative restriction endonuclease [Allokutzneria albata]
MAPAVRIDPDYDREMRDAAMDWLTDLPKTEDGWVKQRQLEDFEFNGVRLPLMDRQAGIRKPAGFDTALSMRTVYTPAGKKPPYKDALGDDGLQRYNYRGEDPEHPDNVGLRNAYKRELPLIWFLGAADAFYLPRYPIWIIGDEPEKLQFVIAASEEQKPENTGPITTPTQRRTQERVTKLRLHQPLFRTRVLHAYKHRCAMCGLGYKSLIEAAHIIPDSEPDGHPEVWNGLALCKLHHGAYDSGIIRIHPENFVLEVREDVRIDRSAEPMLVHGLQGLHGKRLRLPHPSHHPDKNALLWRYNKVRGT